MSYSIRSIDDPETEIAAVLESDLYDIVDPASEPERSGVRWEAQTKRDDALFERAWYADFRERWKRDLQEARFAGRLQALEVTR
jgi:hypothetical protein